MANVYTFEFLTDTVQSRFVEKAHTVDPFFWVVTRKECNFAKNSYPYIMMKKFHMLEMPIFTTAEAQAFLFTKLNQAFPKANLVSVKACIRLTLQRLHRSGYLNRVAVRNLSFDVYEVYEMPLPPKKGKQVLCYRCSKSLEHCSCCKQCRQTNENCMCDFCNICKRLILNDSEYCGVCFETTVYTEKKKRERKPEKDSIIVKKGKFNVPNFSAKKTIASMMLKNSNVDFLQKYNDIAKKHFQKDNTTNEIKD